jgi:outer membrane protein OmpA-like peptidoglycan-associated protein
MPWRYVSVLGLVVCCAFSQVQLHLGGAFLQNWHRAQLQGVAEIVDCGTFRSGQGTGWGAAFGVSAPLSSGVQWELSVLLSQRDGTLRLENSFPIRDTLQGSVVDVATEVQLRSSWLLLEAQPALAFLFGNRLRVLLGIRLGTPLRARFEQSESITSPDSVFFLLEDGQRVRRRILAAGDFRAPARLQFGISAGVEHAASLGGDWQWIQRFGVDYNFTSLLPGVSWRPWSARAEIGIRLRLAKPVAPSPAVPPPQPVREETPPPSPAVQPALALQPLELVARMRVGHELRATSPLVPAVFFEHNSARIPARYSLEPMEAERFWQLDALQLHRFVLPAVAWLVQRHREARVMLEGATSGEDEEGVDLARQRAEAVREALVKLGVPPERITVRWSLLPRVPSNPAYPEGREENRRVDIVLVNAPTIEYVRRQAFRELAGVVRLRTECRAIPAGAPLELTLSCMDTLLRLPCRADTLFTIPLQCRLPQGQEGFPLVLRAVVPAYGVAADVHLELVPGEYPHDTVSLDARYFQAILRFDYNSSQLSPEVEERLRQLVALLPPRARVLIYGSTDALGTERRNVELTQERARRTAEFLQRLSPTLQIQVAALPAEKKFPETFPEGRFLNRSIWVRVEP